MNSDQKNLRSLLTNVATSNYASFMQKLEPNIKVLGVNSANIKKVAKLVMKNSTRCFEISKLTLDEPYLEELMVQAYIIAHLKVENRIELVDKFLQNLRGWALCDFLCSELKEAKEKHNIYWIYIKSKFSSKKPAYVRFAAVMSLKYFILDEYKDEIFFFIKRIDYKEYYLSMGVAWLISTLYLKFPEESLNILRNEKIDCKMRLMAIQKIIDSLKVSSYDKEKLKILRCQMREKN